MTHDGRDWNDHSDPESDDLDLTDIGPEDEDDCPPEPEPAWTEAHERDDLDSVSGPRTRSGRLR